MSSQTKYLNARKHKLQQEVLRLLAFTDTQPTRETLREWQLTGIQKCIVILNNINQTAEKIANDKPDTP